MCVYVTAGLGNDTDKVVWSDLCEINVWPRLDLFCFLDCCMCQLGGMGLFAILFVTWKREWIFGSFEDWVPSKISTTFF